MSETPKPILTTEELVAEFRAILRRNKVTWATMINVCSQITGNPAAPTGVSAPLKWSVLELEGVHFKLVRKRVLGTVKAFVAVGDTFVVAVPPDVVDRELDLIIEDE